MWPSDSANDSSSIACRRAEAISTGLTARGAAGREGRAHGPLQAAFEVVQKSHDGAPFHSCPSRYYGPGWETAENGGILRGGARVGEVPEGPSHGRGGDAGVGVGADLHARAGGG